MEEFFREHRHCSGIVELLLIIYILYFFNGFVRFVPMYIAAMSCLGRTYTPFVLKLFLICVNYTMFNLLFIILIYYTLIISLIIECLQCQP